MQCVVHPTLAAPGERLAGLIGADLVIAETRRFPDGEVYARVPGDVRLTPNPVVLGPTRPNDELLETLFMLDGVQRAGGSSPRLLVPYVSYARQDKVFEPGEAISAGVVASALSRGCSLVVGLDLHAPSVLAQFRCPSRHASAVPELARHLAQAGVDTFLAPDRGAVERARAAAAVVGCAWDFLEKTRVSATEVKVAPKGLDVRGRRVAIIDDIISTGGTMASAAGELKAQGAAAVVVAATHGLFTAGALERLAKAGVDDVVTTDSVPNERARVSCADAMARALRG